VSCRFCSRNCAVTTISSVELPESALPGPGWLACAACVSARRSAGAGSAALWLSGATCAFAEAADRSTATAARQLDERYRLSDPRTVIELPQLLVHFQGARHAPPS